MTTPSNKSNFGLMAGAIVVRVRLKGIFAADSALNEARLRRGFEAGFKSLLGTASAADAIRALFSPSDKVGLKINTIAGRDLSTRPEAALTLAGLLAENGPDLKNLVIWDRTNRELKEAGYRLNLVDKGPRVLGTDTSGFGYEPEIVSHLNIGSRFSTIQSRSTTAVISLALLKDHGTAGELAPYGWRGIEADHARPAPAA